MKPHEPTIVSRLRRVLAQLAVALFTASAAAETPATLEFDGLGVEAEIRIDRHGVAHLRAASEDDVFFVQGVNAARDRLFQIDLWRRRGLGELAAAFGPDFVAQDRATRLFLYRGAIAREWDAYGDAARTRRALQRFAAGVNAWIEWLEAHPEAMPWEFRELGYRPAHWSAEDIVRIRTHGLSGNLLSEVARARTLCLTGSLDVDRWRSPLSDGWKPAAAEGVNPCLPEDVLAEFQRATQGVTFARRSADGAVIALHADADPSPAAQGSNNWVIAPARMATGRALLANDPHRAYQVPSLRYLVHLTAPGLDVIGAGEPALPGISLGHNGRIAFGLTIFPTDQEDLVVYQLHEQDDDRYRVDGRWRRFRMLREQVAVRDGEPVPIELRFAGDEPVIHVDSDSRRAFALRNVWALPGAHPYLASLGYMRARDFPAFRKALGRAGTPPLNYVYADEAGNIAWVVAGLVPLRRKGDGLLPVPGGEAYAWTRMLTGEELPWAFNPAAGFIATANAYNLPPAYPVAERRIGFEWENPARSRRIEEVLGASARMTLDDVLRLQTDVTSIPARRLLALLTPLEGRDAASRAALALLAGWDAGVRADSAPAALAEVWMTVHLRTAVTRAVLDGRALDAVPELDTDVMLEALERPADHLGGAAPRDRLLLDSLAAAYRDCERQLGVDARTWRWGALHTSRLEHRLSSVVDAATRARIDVGPLPVDGSAFTVNMAAPDAGDWRSVVGPSVRLVVDVGNWDASRAINHPGQSGNPDDPHYRDLAAPWSSGEYFPLLYSRAAVDAATERVIRLRPAR